MTSQQSQTKKQQKRYLRTYISVILAARRFKIEVTELNFRMINLKINQNENWTKTRTTTAKHLNSSREDLIDSPM